jgi:hypothetical protein
MSRLVLVSMNNNPYVLFNNASPYSHQIHTVVTIVIGGSFSFIIAITNCCPAFSAFTFRSVAYGTELKSQSYEIKQFCKLLDTRPF